MNKALKFAVGSAVNHMKKKASISSGMLLSEPMLIAMCPTNRRNARCLMCKCWHEKEVYMNKDDSIAFI